MNRPRLVLTVALCVLIAGCNLPAASTPTPDLFATLQASTPLYISSPQATQPSPTVAFNFASVTPPAATSVPAPSGLDQPQGHIVYTCQVYKDQGSEQICMMKADGTDFRRLTPENNIRHFYPSLSPDGRRVLYSAYSGDNNYDIYQYILESGVIERLTDVYGVENAPEFSPDMQAIAFTRTSPTRAGYSIMLTDRNGDGMNNIPQVEGWDPTWSPDGNTILFASDKNGGVQLYTVRTDGTQLKRITNLPAIRGRSDWSADGQFIVTYSGEPWKREVYIMNADGSNVRQLSPSGGNSQGPSFSPDGKWVAFTAYFDNYGDDNGCEVYIIRIDGTDLRRLTNNDYCDYQPRWGP